MHYLQQELTHKVQTDPTLFEFLQAGSLDGVWYWDLEAPENEWMSPRFWEVLGYDPGEMPHKAAAWQDIIFPEDRDLALANFEAHCADPSVPYDLVVRYLHRDGSTVWVRCRGLVLRDHKGQPTRMLGVHVDLTEMMSSRQKLERANAELLMAEDLAGVGHWSVVVATGRLQWSPQVFAIHGRDPALGEPNLADAINYYHPSDRDRVLALVDAGMASGEPWSFEATLVRDDGLERKVLSRSRTERDGLGNITAVFGVFQDVTEVRMVQEQLQRAERLASIGTLASSVAHEVNNPLSYVSLNTDFLLEVVANLQGTIASDDHAELVDLLDDLRDGVDRIQRIILGLKGFARTAEREEQVIPLGQVVRTALRLCQNEMDHAGSVRVVEGDGPLHVRADEGQIVQVSVNLLQNALHAAKEGRHLTMTIEIHTPRDGWGALTVRDNGVGMSPDVLARASEPFFTTKKKDVGTGLGMFVSKGIIEAHGGQLQIESTAGEGTTVTVLLPLAEHEAVARSDTPREANLGPRARILVVDDQPRVAKSVARALKPHHVDLVTNPNEAIEIMAAHGEQYDVVFCDLMMPGARGEDVYRSAPPHLRPRFRFLTGGTFTPGSEDFAAEMRDRVLDKPPNPRQLLAEVEEALRKRGDS